MNKMIPFIQIELIETLEKDLSHQEILQIVKSRFERIHNISGEWLGSPPYQQFRLEYPSEDFFLRCYEYGLPFFEKLDEILQDKKLGSTFPVSNLIKKTAQKVISPFEMEENPRNYCVLRYYTNFKEPMRRNYQYTGALGELLQSEFYIEEVEDGFIIFYRNRDDFWIPTTRSDEL